MQQRPTIIAGNWKMHKTISEATAFVKGLLPLMENAKNHVYIATPFTSIGPCALIAKDSALKIGAQNMSDQDEGAFTGEISAKMLHDAGASFVLLGHSERRALFNETDEHIHHKLKQAMKVNLPPILCIGEEEEARSSGQFKQVLEMQIDGAIGTLKEDELDGVVIAYEPVWAIGTGKTATAEIAEETHKMIRSYLATKLSPAFAEKTPILYGGSVKPANIQTLLSEPNIDGALIGGASLDVESFSQMVNS